MGREDRDRLRLAAGCDSSDIHTDRHTLTYTGRHAAGDDLHTDIQTRMAGAGAVDGDK